MEFLRISTSSLMQISLPYWSLFFSEAYGWHVCQIWQRYPKLFIFHCVQKVRVRLTYARRDSGNNKSIPISFQTMLKSHNQHLTMTRCFKNTCVHILHSICERLSTAMHKYFPVHQHHGYMQLNYLVVWIHGNSTTCAWYGTARCNTRVAINGGQGKFAPHLGTSCGSVSVLTRTHPFGTVFCCIPIKDENIKFKLFKKFYNV